VAKYPPNEEPTISDLEILRLFKNPRKNSIKKSIVYSAAGLSLYPKPIISGITTLKCLDSIVDTYNQRSAEAPRPCRRTKIFLSTFCCLNSLVKDGLIKSRYLML
jgi:hypothetical protein